MNNVCSDDARRGRRGDSNEKPTKIQRMKTAFSKRIFTLYRKHTLRRGLMGRARITRTRRDIKGFLPRGWFVLPHRQARVRIGTAAQSVAGQRL